LIGASAIARLQDWGWWLFGQVTPRPYKRERYVLIQVAARVIRVPTVFCTKASGRRWYTM
jgi:hypothetical protein